MDTCVRASALFMGGHVEVNVASDPMGVQAVATRPLRGDRYSLASLPCVPSGVSAAKPRPGVLACEALLEVYSIYLPFPPSPIALARTPHNFSLHF